MLLRIRTFTEYNVICVVFYRVNTRVILVIYDGSWVTVRMGQWIMGHS